MLKRVCVLIALLLAALMAGGPAAAVDVYPLPTTGQGTVDRSVVRPGECVVFSGDGFAPNTELVITDNGVRVGTTRTDASGRFSTQVCFSTDAVLGEHLLEARGVGANGAQRVVSAVVTLVGLAVTAPDDASGLPLTGQAILVIVAVGLGALLAGSALLRLGRRSGRRRRRTPAAAT